MISKSRIFNAGMCGINAVQVALSESLLIGLPVPGIFLYKEDTSQIMKVIDGQQRLRSLIFYSEGTFNEEVNQLFRLHDLKTRFADLSYEELPIEDRRKLDNSIIHATVIRQEKPDDKGSSQFFVFERLNTEAMALRPQEIRSAIYQGDLNDLLSELDNENPWRELLGRVTKRKRGEELILRFLSLYFKYDDYEPPMKSFLNDYMSENRDLRIQDTETVRDAFIPVVNTILDKIGADAFKPNRPVNAAVLDAVMIGVAKRLETGAINGCLRKEYDDLIKDERFF